MENVSESLLDPIQILAVNHRRQAHR